MLYSFHDIFNFKNFISNNFNYYKGLLLFEMTNNFIIKISILLFKY